MKKYRIVLLLFLLSEFAIANPEYCITDFVSGTRLNFSRVAESSRTARFNRFDEVYFEFPQISRSDFSHVSSLNERIRNYCVSYFETDSFGIELKQKSDQVIQINNQKRRYDYSYDSEEKKSVNPYLISVTGKFMFLRNSVLGLMVDVTFGNTRTADEYRKDMLHLTYEYLIDLGSGREFKPADLIARTSVSAFESFVERKMYNLSLTYKSVLEQNAAGYDEAEEEYSEDEYEGENEDQEETQEEGRGRGLPSNGNLVRNQPDLRQFIGFKLAVSDFLIIADPDSLNLIVPPFTEATGFSSGAGFCFRVSYSELNRFSIPGFPLFLSARYFPERTPVNMDVNNSRIPHLSYEELINESPDKQVPVSGLRAINVFRVNPDGRSNEIYSRTTFGANGYPDSFYSYSYNTVYSSTCYHWHNNRLLLKEVKSDENEVYINKYEYDIRNNLIREFEQNGSSEISERRYFYSGSTGYLVMQEQILSAEWLENLQRSVYFFDRNGKLVNSSEDYAIPDWKYVYEGNRVIGATNRNGYQQLVQYNKQGQLIYLESDNGRYYTQFEYDLQGRISKIYKKQDYSVELTRFVYSNGLLTELTISDLGIPIGGVSEIRKYTFSYE